MIVCGQSAVASGLIARLMDDLAAKNLTVTLFDYVRGEPDLDVVTRGIEVVKSSESDVVIGVGGGSALDAAKAIAGLAPQSGDVAELFYRGDFPADPIPWIAIATTAGSGADVTHPAVLIDRSSGTKRSIRDPRWFARVAIVDPELTLSNPPSVTAHSGMDALTQAIESHVSLGANALTQALSRQATVLIGRNLHKAYVEGDNLAHRESVMMGATMAGMALAVARLGLVHGMAHEVGMACNAPHGLVCAMLLPSVIEFNMADERANQLYAELAEFLGLEKSAEALLTWVVELGERLNIPKKLKSMGLRPEHVPRIVSEALQSGSTKANPRVVHEHDVRDLVTRHV